MALETPSQSGELIWVTQRLRLQEIRTGKGSLCLSGWRPKALGREWRASGVEAQEKDRLAHECGRAYGAMYPRVGWALDS